MNEKLRPAARGLANNVKMSAPILVGVLLLVALVNTAVPPNAFSRVFTGIGVVDALIGAAVGGVAAGNPLTSYVIGGELLDTGVSLFAVIAFVVSWVTIGVVQLPAERLMLGRRFAVVRNMVSFVLAVIIAGATVLTVGVL
jgi:hypothetical protein